MNESTVPPAPSLQHQSDFLRQVIDMSPNLIFVKDREGKFVLVNRALAEAYGSTVENLVGKGDADFNANQAEVEHFRRDDLEVMDLLKEKLIPEEILTSPTGEIRYLQTIKRPLVDPDGVARHILGVSSDITQLKLAAEERRELEAQVLHTQKLESLGLLAGGIAHDFNNMLMGVMGYADLAQMEVPRDSPALESIKNIQVAAQRAADLCKQLLDYSGKGRFAIEPASLTIMVEEIVDLLKISISKNAALHFDLGQKLFRIAADPTQVRQIIMNLITNASDAIGATPGVISVITGYQECDAEFLQGLSVGEDLEPGPYVYLEVADNGEGMGPETLEKVFDPFFTTKSSGRGLGLAAVLGIVRGHHGGISITSKLNRGTTVKVLFPALKAGAPQGDEADDGDSDRRITRNQGTVLVVDDEEMVLAVSRRILESAGFTVLTAGTGREAVEIFRQKADEIRIVLLDLTMPRMDGQEVYNEIQAVRRDVSVILMSGFNESDAIQRFGSRAPTEFLTKPFGADEVLDSIRRIEDARSRS